MNNLENLCSVMFKVFSVCLSAFLVITIVWVIIYGVFYEEKTNVVHDNHNNVYFLNKISFENHDYIIISNAGITHDENCSCKQ